MNSLQQLHQPQQQNENQYKIIADVRYTSKKLGNKTPQQIMTESLKTNLAEFAIKKQYLDISQTINKGSLSENQLEIHLNINDKILYEEILLLKEIKSNQLVIKFQQNSRESNDYYNDDNFLGNQEDKVNQNSWFVQDIWNKENRNSSNQNNIDTLENNNKTYDEKFPSIQTLDIINQASPNQKIQEKMKSKKFNLSQNKEQFPSLEPNHVEHKTHDSDETVDSDSNAQCSPKHKNMIIKSSPKQNFQDDENSNLNDSNWQKKASKNSKLSKQNSKKLSENKTRVQPVAKQGSFSTENMDNISESKINTIPQQQQQQQSQTNILPNQTENQQKQQQQKDQQINKRSFKLLNSDDGHNIERQNELLNLVLGNNNNNSSTCNDVSSQSNLSSEEDDQQQQSENSSEKKQASENQEFIKKQFLIQQILKNQNKFHQIQQQNLRVQEIILQQSLFLNQSKPQQQQSSTSQNNKQSSTKSKQVVSSKPTKRLQTIL